MATHPSILAGEFHGQRSPAGCSHWGCRRGEQNLVTTTSNRINNEPVGEVVESYMSILCLTETGWLLLDSNDDRDCQIMSFKLYWASCAHFLCLPFFLVYVPMDPWIQWVRVHYYYFLFWCSECSRFGDWELLQFGLCALLGIYHVILGALFFFWEGTRIRSYGARWSSLSWTLSALGLDSTISVKNPGSLVGVILEHKIWKLGVLIATKVSWRVTAFSVDRLGETAMSYHSCLSPFYIGSSFLSLWEQWVPRRLVYHSSAQF